MYVNACAAGIGKRRPAGFHRKLGSPRGEAPFKVRLGCFGYDARNGGEAVAEALDRGLRVFSRRIVSSRATLFSNHRFATGGNRHNIRELGAFEQQVRAPAVSSRHAIEHSFLRIGKAILYPNNALDHWAKSGFRGLQNQLNAIWGNCLDRK